MDDRCGFVGIGAGRAGRRRKRHRRERAGFGVGILEFLGAVVQGGNDSRAVGRESVRDVALSPVAATVALVIAATLVAAGVFRGYPIATAFTVTGTVLGVALGYGCYHAIAAVERCPRSILPASTTLPARRVGIPGIRRGNVFR